MGPFAKTMSIASRKRSPPGIPRRCASWSATCTRRMSAHLIEALDGELRPRLVELMGDDFDFSALTEVDDTVREEILEELPAETVAEGVRELDSDDAVDHPRGSAQGRADRDSGATPDLRAGRAGAQPRLPGKLGRPAHADRAHCGGAVVDGRADHRLHARDPGSAGAFLGALCHRSRPPAEGRSGARSPAADQAARADRRSHR